MVILFVNTSKIKFWRSDRGRLWSEDVEGVAKTLEEQAEGLGHLLWLLLQHHPRLAHLEPGAGGGAQLEVGGEAGLQVRAVLPHDVEDGHLHAVV